jgi:DNA-binding MarR family transcriptional regulator
MKRAALTEDVYRGVQEVVVLLDEGDRRTLRALGLTPTHFALLRLLVEQDGLPVTRLAERLLCTRGNATRLVQRLAEAGLVTTRVDDADQRLVRVVLTDAGADRVAAASAYHAALNERRFAGLSTTDLATLRELLATVSTLLSKENAR